MTKLGQTTLLKGNDFFFISNIYYSRFHLREYEVPVSTIIYSSASGYKGLQILPFLAYGLSENIFLYIFIYTWYKVVIL